MDTQVRTFYRSKGWFTLATLVCETVSDSDMRQSLDCQNGHVTVLALATLGDTTQIHFYFCRAAQGGQGMYVAIDISLVEQLTD
jgi:hypothetical protein